VDIKKKKDKLIVRGKKSVVTGGAGFIGSNLIDHLIKAGHKVIVLDNFVSGKRSNISHHKKKHVQTVKIDISKNTSLDKYFSGADYVFHLAGLAEIIPSIKNPKKYFFNNVLGTLNVVEAAKKAKVKKLIYAASSSCYGKPKIFPTSEKSKIDLKHPYALTKYMGEELIMKYASLFSMPNISFRFFNVYGPRLNTSSQYSAVMGTFLLQKRNNKPLTIVGDGKQTRDFIHVDDLINAFLKVAKSKSVNKIYNLGSGKRISINTVAKIFGGKKKYIPKRPGEPKHSLADISKIKKEINWKPKISIEEGIKKLLNN
jgi:UDP-glucose 4-epimerase